VASLSEVGRKIGSESFVAGNAKAILGHMREHANEDLIMNVKMVYDLEKRFPNQYSSFLQDHSCMHVQASAINNWLVGLNFNPHTPKRAH